DDIASHIRCVDFVRFQPMFEKIERELKSGLRRALRFGGDTSIERGNLFILAGQIAYVAEVSDDIQVKSGHEDSRLRVIYGNGTESNLFCRRRLNIDPPCRSNIDPGRVASF
ncbi:MAG: hypothetical protein RLZZ573_2023, partial [Pseudomonadota bacterium]